ncbi:DUF4843 domain-containing protein [Sphingobacterium tabacisoli]|uniref:DUF4843 domain-containing protein n=1 Tax=Sphingobacterium tabacisoli TaxID=2044855 RepID=A0ABW5KWB6_9SPHI|nr:DUF4843 domain-containing protein [Sphingobacterium tabacisoli]
MRHIILFVAVISTFASCKKEGSLEYQAGSGAYIVAQLSDSLSYSFANNVAILTKDTIFLEVQVLGDVTDYEREIQLHAVGGSTATEGLHYKLPAMKLPAGAHNLIYPVVLFNTEDLATKTVRLELELKPNQDFVNGPGMISSRGLYRTYKINFNNRLIKPSYWLYIQNYFGEYSDVKYRFMIEVLGMSDFMPDYVGGTMGYSESINYGGIMSGALQKYEDEFGPKLDETGKQISFPL